MPSKKEKEASNPTLPPAPEASPSAALASGKQRGPSGHVANACTSCKKRRTKCDGGNPCSKCASRSVANCTYEVSLKTSKEEMKREINELRQQEAIATRIFTALAADRDVSAILQGLRNRDDLFSIAKAIKYPEPSEASSFPSPNIQDDSIASDSPSDQYASTEASSSQRGFGGPTSSPADISSAKSQLLLNSEGISPSSQSDALRELKAKACQGPTDLSDQRLIRHLFSVYWVWSHPIHMVLNMQAFVDSYETGLDTYCSTFLVYAVSIAACDDLDPDWERVEGKSTHVESLRQNLIATARTLETTANPEAETTRQALAILALVSARPRYSMENVVQNYPAIPS